MRKEKPRYSFQRKNEATFRGVLRGAMSFYLAYLGCQVIKDYLNGEQSASTWGAPAGAAFILIAACFGIYAWKHYRTDMKNAELTPRELAMLEEEDDSQAT